MTYVGTLDSFGSDLACYWVVIWLAAAIQYAINRLDKHTIYARSSSPIKFVVSLDMWKIKASSTRAKRHAPDTEVHVAKLSVCAVVMGTLMMTLGQAPASPLEAIWEQATAGTGCNLLVGPGLGWGKVGGQGQGLLGQGGPGMARLRTRRIPRIT